MHQDQEIDPLPQHISSLLSLSPSEESVLLTKSTTLSNTASLHFTNRDFTTALKYYSLALSHFPSATSHCNIASCYWEMSEYRQCLDSCGLALELDELVEVRRMRVNAACKVGDITSLSLALVDLEFIEGEEGVPSKEWVKEEMERAEEIGRIEDHRRVEAFGVELLEQLGIDPSIITSNRPT
jgi:tetratricopeptide (TPR) repeat protein